VKLSYGRNNADSGDVPAGAKEYKPGDTATVAGNTGNLGRTGFVYAGWNTKTDRSGDSYVEGDTITIGGADVTLYAKRDEIIPGFNYTTSEGKATITKYTGSDANATIPATINGLPVTVIGARAFEACASLVSVTIPKSATFIGDYAFTVARNSIR
jgi:hypothetical protein